MTKPLRPAGCALAALLSTVALAAQAQYKLEYAGNTLVIGGRLNVTYDHSELSGFTPGAADDPGLASSTDRVFGANASRINFTLNRKFESGYTAEVFLDSSLNPTAGSGTLAGRENWIGASGPLGRFRAGRIDTPVKQMGEYTDVFYATGIADDGEIQMMGGEDKLIGFTRRQQKSLRYDSPKFGGAAIAVQLALPNADGAAGADAPPNNGRKGRVYSAALTYADGPLSAGLGLEGHDKVRFINQGTETVGLKDAGIRFGAKYVFAGIGDLGFGANYFRYSGSVTRTFFAVTGNAYVGPGKLVMRYGRAGDVGGTAADGAVVCGTVNTAATNTCSGTLRLVKGPESGAQQIVIGYDSPIDKQTSVYGYFTQMKNDKNANYNYGTNAYGALKGGNSLKGISVGAIYIF